MDYCATSALALDADPGRQDGFVRAFADGIAKQREAYWRAADEKDWPDAALLLAAPDLASRGPIVWHVEFHGRAASVERVANPVYMEGSYDSVFPLLYGFDGSVLSAVGRQLGVDAEALNDALAKITVLKSIEKLNVEVMPVHGRDGSCLLPRENADRDGPVPARRSGVRRTHRPHGLEDRARPRDRVLPRKGRTAPRRAVDSV